MRYVSMVLIGVAGLVGLSVLFGSWFTVDQASAASSCATAPSPC